MMKDLAITNKAVGVHICIDSGLRVSAYQMAQVAGNKDKVISKWGARLTRKAIKELT